jgi:hypothetical protein
MSAFEVATGRAHVYADVDQDFLKCPIKSEGAFMMLNQSTPENTSPVLMDYQVGQLLHKGD